jgi:predicted lipoprotein
MAAPGITAIRSRKAQLALVAAACSSVLVAGCKVVTVDQDRALRARHGASFDAAASVEAMWQGRVLPVLTRAAVPIPQIFQAIDQGFAQAGGRFGRQTGEGAPWTFVARGEGVVTAVNATARRGTVELAVAGRPVLLQVGPVVTGTAIRDALPFITFNDYSDQLAFADLGRALTRRSMAALGPRIAALRPGAHVAFVGAFNLASAGDPVLVTPIAIGTASAHAG